MMTWSTATLADLYMTTAGRGSSRTTFPWSDYHINYEEVSIDELYENYTNTTTTPQYTFNYGAKPPRWILNDDPPEIGDITEEDVDKLLKV